MMENRRQEEKFLIGLLDQLLASPGADWALEDVSAILSKHLFPKDLGTYSLIQKIDRHCIEDVCKTQAKDLYEFFPVPHIRAQLEADYLAMEHERARNNFSNFALHSYQQIECLTNYLFKTEWIREAFKSFSSKEAYVYKNFKDSTTYRGGQPIRCAVLRIKENFVSPKIDSDNYPVSSITYDKTKDWTAKEKMRLVYYFGVVSAQVSSEDFNTFNQKLENIYEARNLNHRPMNKTYTRMSAQLEMLSFYGTLASFVNGIAQNISNLNGRLLELPFAKNKA